ncbi:ABC transporter permease [Desulfurococcus mucosus]|uniref:Binding-protein-dependent transport systems inner membrane component n=1 Tax=Desulfurococcus mucosus (strain ATCC 35584 / DSM 2162 / JCM 9187 / O7/1) TaxID=765177 RepID=E8R8N5_DESM0|nr:ABC transporter permease [Desulfurococcus mucosus]ADV64861.1 binding-protein-dependent transport systems inner membrane component [Desulfurococcus mucosus DSM 2162]
MPGLGRYLVIRALMIVPTVLILYTLVFIVLRVLPGDPVLAVVGTKNISPEQLEYLRRLAGLDKPLYQQYVDYLIGVFKGDFGRTLANPVGKPVADYLAERLPATIELTVFAFIVSVVIGLSTGLAAAVKNRSRMDAAMRVYSIVSYSLFIPILGITLQYVFGVLLKILPTGGRLSARYYVEPVTGFMLIDTLIAGDPGAFADAVAHLVLPSLTLGIVLSGSYTRLVRNNMVEVLRSDFIRSYRARGIPEGRVLRYAFKNVLIPVVTYMGLQVAMLLGGAVLTETTFSWPGIGRFIVERIEYRDYTSIQGVVVVYALIVGLVSLVVDAVYALIDPRVRY